MRFCLFFLVVVLLGNNYELAKADEICGHQTVTSSGASAGIGEFPWLALLKYKGAGFELASGACVGTLINSRYILTAGHCVATRHAELAEIWLGELDVTTDPDCEQTAEGQECGDPALKFGVEKTIVHEAYNLRKKEHNLALIRLDKDVKFTEFVQPICLPTPDTTPAAPGDSVSFSGWGLLTMNGTPAQKKKKMFGTIITNEDCKQKLTGKIVLPDGIMCTEARNDSVVFTCQGDSGGPVMFYSGNRWQQEGIVSFGIGCGLQFPDANTRLRDYVDWVQKNIQP